MTAPAVTTAVERVRALADDLDYAAMPTKPDVVTLCGWSAGQARDALRTILSDHARLSAALGEAREAREALEPFAAVLVDVGTDEAEADTYKAMSVQHRSAPAITVGDLRRARTALQQQEQ